MRAVFATGSGRRFSATARVTRRTRASVIVPTRARSGVLYVRDRHGRRSNRVRRPLRVVARPSALRPPASSSTVFDGNGMWIWYVSKADGGDPAAIAADARAHGIATVFVKSADGTTAWPQFSPDLVGALKAAGLRVCAWQFAYGTHPVTEAARGAEAVAAGADCLVVDAESDYEGRYAQAQQYVAALRDAIGPDFPVGLTSFPYVDYHPSLPYSVLLGPGGAQFNLPQAYWKAIGGGVDAVVAHTYGTNRPYGRPIMPLGQLYDDPSSADVARFRSLVNAAGSTGLSWWDWQHAGADQWDALAAPLAPLTTPAPAMDPVTLASGAKGDLVVWAQEHLGGAKVTGRFDSATKQAVIAFQTGAGLPATGQIDPPTWAALLQVAPTPVDWTASDGATASAASAHTGPPTAAMPARRYEIPRSLGAR
jgi:peptidoglycan hydrolase-like protein with peptidoglycan-binding domain